MKTTTFDILNQFAAGAAMETNAFDRFLCRLKTDSFTLEPSAAIKGENIARQPDAQPYEVRNGAAIIQIHGPMIRTGPEWLAEFFGLALMDRIGSAIEHAAENAAVDSILLDIDSPGGTVSGTPELAAAVRAAEQIKPVDAYTGGMMASAAYYVGAQAGTVMATPSAIVGSIGVLRVHVDFDAMRENEGINVEVFRSGELKAPGIAGTGLTDTQRDNIQETIEAAFLEFVDAVTAPRPQLAAELFDGRTVSGNQAEAVGLIDGTVESLAAAIGDKKTVDDLTDGA